MLRRGENVRATVIGSDETKSPLLVEHLNFARRHASLLGFGSDSYAKILELNQKSPPCDDVRYACRNSVLVSLILEINCTDGLCREKAIENILLLFLGFRTFSHSLGHQRTW